MPSPYTPPPTPAAARHLTAVREPPAVHEQRATVRYLLGQYAHANEHLRRTQLVFGLAGAVQAESVLRLDGLGGPDSDAAMQLAVTARALTALATALFGETVRPGPEIGGAPLGRALNRLPRACGEEELAAAMDAVARTTAPHVGTAGVAIFTALADSHRTHPHHTEGGDPA